MCTSPLYRVKDFVYKEGVKTPSLFLKKRFYNFLDYTHLVDNLGFPAEYFNKIRCGQCLECRLQHAKEWSERCMFEAQFHKSNYFITLTYNDDSLSYSKIGLPTLNKRDIQLFHKRLRNYSDFRFFLGAEYGSRTFRPHAHGIYFGLDLPDLEFYKLQRSKNGVYEYFISPTLEKIWGKGFCTLTKVTSETCAYTARYSIKKLGYRNAASYLEDPYASDEQIHTALQSIGSIEPVFSLMSRKPGIGCDFYVQNRKIILNEDRLPGSILKHLRYFDKITEKEEPQTFFNIKEARQAYFQLDPRERTSYTRDEYLDVKRDLNDKRKFIEKL